MLIGHKAHLARDPQALPPDLIRCQPKFPPEFSHLLGALSAFPAPIDWAAFEAHSRMARRRWARWELDVLAHIDRKRQS